MLIRTVDITTEADIVTARSAGRELARDLSFGIADQTRLATAISELARNVVRYAGKGFCHLRDETVNGTSIIGVTVEDSGPGIPDIDRAMKDGFSTGKSLGAGLPGTNRLVKDMRIESRPGSTKISFRIISVQR